MYRLYLITVCWLLFSGIIIAQTKESCLVCHADNALTMEKNGKTVSLFAKEEILNKSPHAKLSCVSCHAGFDPENIPHVAKIQPVQCRSCHKDAPAKHAFHATARSSGADPSALCKECHGTHDIVSPKVPGSKLAASNIAEFCGTCHATQREIFMASVHGQALKANVENAPTCMKCHSVLMSSKSAGTDTAGIKIAQEKMCLACHGTKDAANGVTAQYVMGYEQSVHAQGLRKGNGNAATCINCHGSHGIKKGGDPNSPVAKTHIQNACAQCHKNIAGTYSASIHGTALAKGNMSAPACTDCHGEHKILGPKDANSPVSKLHVSAEVCTPCHNSVKMSEKFGIATGRSESYLESYHGLAVKAGKTEAANCASCHGVHDILPSSDVRSRINKGNLAQTCGQCHPGANNNFAQGAVHVSSSKPTDSGMVFLVTNIYISLIIATIGGMFLHNVLDFVKKSRRRLKHRRHGPDHDEEIGHALYLRMTISERLQHGVLALSFTLLVFTGFMLRYPDAWWVLPLRSLSPIIFDIRGIVHRCAAVALVVGSLYHIYYILFVPRGRQLIRDLFPKIQDVYDALGMAKYNLGFSEEKPLLDRFSYVEKAEYWALIWGTIVMSATGLILWLDNTFMGIIGKEWWDVSRTVHFYEAWLAALSILVWHFYFTIFNPDMYPMNLAWIHGTISEEEMNDEHPLELDRILEEENAKHEETKNSKSRKS